MTIGHLQYEHRQWLNHNFGPGDNQAYVWQFVGITEEVGELAHALLKQHQGIRGTDDEHTAAARDAVGDIFIFLMGFCSRMGFDLEEVIEETWAEVKLRDWTKGKEQNDVA